MLSEFLLAVLLLPAMLLVWVAVQNAWRKQFHGEDDDVDVLAGRSECGRCGCARPCGRDDEHTELQTRRS